MFPQLKFDPLNRSVTSEDLSSLQHDLEMYNPNCGLKWLLNEEPTELPDSDKNIGKSDLILRVIVKNILPSLTSDLRLDLIRLSLEERIQIAAETAGQHANPSWAAIGNTD